MILLFNGLSICFFTGLRMKNRSITTKIGDKGTTRLFTGQEVSKCSARPDAYGDLDELVSMLGLAKTLVKQEELPKLLENVQQILFQAGAELASDGTPYTDPVGHERVAEIDALAADLEARIEMPQGFILPGGTQAGATLDVARTIARRLERKVVRMTEDGLLDNPHLIVWLNRLSDSLWLCARFEEGDATKAKDG